MRRFLSLFLVSLGIRAGEFVYPVAALPGTDTLLIIYQKTPHHIELWEWNPHTLHAENVLLSRFTPAGLKFLPDYSGYSFVDNGLIRIKRWHKRSPRTLELEIPLIHIEHLYWIDSHICYTSGKYLDNFGIFQLDDEGTVYPILYEKNTDFLYPQKMGESLFCIERYKGFYRIVKSFYQVRAETEGFSNRIDQPRGALLDNGLEPIIFLMMVSEEEGFYISHPRAISKRDEVIEFGYYHLYKNGVTWISEKLFSFSVKTTLIFTGSSFRLYEALLPLLPKKQGDLIYYTHSQQNAMNLYSFDMNTKETRQITQLYDGYYFAPFFCSDRMIWGGQIRDNQSDYAVKMKVSDLGIQFYLGQKYF